MDKIVQGNTSNIVFLKSTDDSMLETLEKMSGVRHKTYSDSKTVTRDQAAIMKMKQNEGKISITMTTKEEHVISYNDMAFISPRNSIVFRAGDAPIWNRNQMVLPMSWRLFKTKIEHPGHDYSLQTIPTLSTAMDFDVRKNQPNFNKMLDKRMEQAYLAVEAQKQYQEAYGYSDYEMEQLDLDNKSDEIMDIVYSSMNPKMLNQAMVDIADNEDGKAKNADLDNSDLEELFDYIYGNQDKISDKFEVEQDIYNQTYGAKTATENTEQMVEIQKQSMEQGELLKKRYAGGTLSRDDIIPKTGPNHSLDQAFIRVYKKLRSRLEKDEKYFLVVNGNLMSADGRVTYIKNLTSSDSVREINDSIESNDRVHSFDGSSITQEDMKAIGSFDVTTEFLEFLVTFPGAWPFADGEFDRRMKEEFLEETDDPERQMR